MTKLTKRQVRTFGPRPIPSYGKGCTITATVRHDDSCGNGHNTFAITGEIRDPRVRRDNGIVACGCLHDEIARVFPELKPLIRFHLMSTDGPLSYIADTLFWLGYSGYCDGKPRSPPSLEYARSSAVWPDMPEAFLAPSRYQGSGPSRGHQTLDESAAHYVTQALLARLPQLKADFRAAVESLGMEF